MPWVHWAFGNVFFPIWVTKKQVVFLVASIFFFKETFAQFNQEENLIWKDQLHGISATCIFPISNKIVVFILWCLISYWHISRRRWKRLAGFCGNEIRHHFHASYEDFVKKYSTLYFPSSSFISTISNSNPIALKRKWRICAFWWNCP